jgi:TPR repeat protein
MTIAQQPDSGFTGIDDLTLAQVEAKLIEHQQLLQVLLQTPGNMLSYLPIHDGAAQQSTELEAIYQQGLLYAEQQELHQAATLYCRAAYMGHVQAQVQLGHCYLKGAGVPKSAVFAYSWFILAALQQDNTAEQACTVLCKHLTLVDQQNAQQLAAERFEKITLKNNK